MSGDAAPMWLLVRPSEPGYADAVVVTIGRISRTGSGRTMLEQIRQTGVVTIDKPAQTDPPNASVRREDAGAAPQCAIAFDARDWPSPVAPNSLPADEMLFTLFREALGQLQGAISPGQPQSDQAATDEANAVARYRSERDNV